VVGHLGDPQDVPDAAFFPHGVFFLGTDLLVSQQAHTNVGQFPAVQVV
jgi:hypothetical protein